MTDVACESFALCVAVDNTGDAVVGTAPSRTLSVALAGSGSGSVTGPGLSCPSTCSSVYPPGTLVTLSATPAAGSTFSDWTGAGCSGAASCTVTLSEDQSVTATFTATATPPPPPPPHRDKRPTDEHPAGRHHRPADEHCPAADHRQHDGAPHLDLLDGKLEQCSNVVWLSVDS